MGKRRGSGPHGFGSYEENLPGSDITAEEWAFLQAMEAYKRRFKRRYPSWREVLAVAKSIGYRKQPTPADNPVPGDTVIGG